MKWKRIVNTWYYTSSAGQNLGPISDELLSELVRAGTITSSTPVWRQGMAQWLPAGEVFGLFQPMPRQVPAPAPLLQLPAAVLPPTPPGLPPTLPQTSRSPVGTAERDKANASKKTVIAIVVASVAGLLGLAVLLAIGSAVALIYLPNGVAEFWGVKIIDKKNFVERDGLMYEASSETPFTGVTVDKYENGQKREEATYKDGKLHGKYARWHKNGQKAQEVTFENGKVLMPYGVWYENGQLAIEFVDGEIAILREKNGQKRVYDNQGRDAWMVELSHIARAVEGTN